MTDTLRTTVEIPGSGGGGPEREFTVEARSYGKMVLRRFLHHKLAVASLIVLILVVLLALLGGRFWKYKYAVVYHDIPISEGPTLSHPFGTDAVGHDVFGQVLRGAQKSVQIMLVVALLSTVIGVLIGAISGFYRGIIDSVLMRFVDLILTIPLLAIVAVLAKMVQDSKNWFLLSVVLGLLVWTGLARIVRAEFLSLREKEFVEAARALGAKDRRIIFRHILPNVMGSIIVAATLTMATAILLETALSFLGFGVQHPDTSLGKLVSDGQTAAITRPWLFYFPGLFIIVIVLCVNFVGDGLRDAFDPKQTRVRA